MNKISVVMPNYNDSKYFDRWFDNLNNQTELPFEVIIIDDCSTDNSVSILQDIQKKYPEGFLRIIRNEQNMGVFKSFMRGVREAKGDFIAGWSCDDEMKCGYIEKMSKAIKDYPTIDLFLCRVIIERESEWFWANCNISVEPMKCFDPDSFADALKSNALRCFIGHIIRKDQLIEYWCMGAYELKSNFDAMYIYFSALSKGSVLVNDFLAIYHASFKGFGSSRGFKRNREAERIILRICEKYYPRIYPKLIASRAFNLRTSIVAQTALWLVPKLPRFIRIILYKRIYEQ